MSAATTDERREEGERQARSQLWRYLVVGGFSAAIELVVFELLYSAIGLSVAVSNVAALLLSTGFNFAMNGTYTFRIRGGFARCLVKYVALFVFDTLLSTAIVAFLIQAGAWSVVAKAAAMCIIVPWNFFMYRKVVFV